MKNIPIKSGHVKNKKKAHELNEFKMRGYNLTEEKIQWGGKQEKQNRTRSLMEWGGGCAFLGPEAEGPTRPGEEAWSGELGTPSSPSLPLSSLSGPFSSPQKLEADLLRPTDISTS